jgi:glycosyltransferase involved in cell wall biosynthesis
MSSANLASIIITSYNYGRYLGEAIDSALNQTYARTEVIVVDDGSTDNSRAVIASYGDRIIPLLKENGGQASALNAGFTLSRGEVVLFLDSDDMLLPTAVEEALRRFAPGDVAKVHWPLRVIDEEGRMTREVVTPDLPEGDLREVLLRDGPDGYTWPPTSGNAWARSFLERVLPMPEPEYRTCPDYYLSAFVPLFGAVRTIQEPQAIWRGHVDNHIRRAPFEERLHAGVQRADHCLGELGRYCCNLGLDVDPEVWKRSSWWHQIDTVIREVTARIPPGAAFILVDEDAWDAGELVAGRRRIPFPERDGQYGGALPDDQAAVQELERLRQSGASLIVFTWPHLWWLEYYRELHCYLHSQFRCVLEDDRLVIFDLQAPAST